jgi:diadenosine tetraphosphate (Ap4A) HIT family hydrolase
MVLHPGWGDDFEARRGGEGCPMCDRGGASDEEHGVGFMTGRWATAFLGRRPVRRGYGYVIWTGRHVAEPTELTAEEAAGFWHDVATAALAIEERYEPLKMNWMALGNSVPHLHVHLVPRHRDDLAAGGPVESEAFDAEATAPLDDATMAEEVAALRLLVAPRARDT